MKTQPLLVTPGTKVDLADFDPNYCGQYQSKRDAAEELDKHLQRLADLQELLYGESKHALLVVLQGMDAAGKDGTVRHVMNAFNPQGVRVVSFKVPTPEELAHDFLWRIHRSTPRLGETVIFNRSQYEDVLVVRVDGLVAKPVWKARYDHINHFERLLSDAGVVILKFFLHISKDEQKRRFQERFSDPTKQWKFSVEDVKKRAQWEDYQEAYAAALTECSTEWAPWYVVPADRKWYRNLVISQAIVDSLQKLDMHYPPLPEEARNIHIE
jgi:PPK2 family polyphosphate:nucleotide phosphotransferase